MIDGQTLTNGTHTFTAPLDSEITGTLLNGNQADFELALVGGTARTATLNVNVGIAPAVPEPAPLAALGMAGGAALLFRRRVRVHGPDSIHHG